MITTAMAFAGAGRVEINQKQMTTLPYQITQPGRYVLTSSLNVTHLNENAIWVSASDVEIDLNGFTITGPGAGGTLSGIFQSAAHRNLVVYNGNLANWSGGSVWSINASGADNAFRDISVSGGARGIFSGNHSRIEACLIYSNRANGVGYGIQAGSGSRILRCNVLGSSSTNNIMYGIYAGANSEVRDCVVLRPSAATTVYGIYGEANVRVTGCVVRDSVSGQMAYGIFVSDGGSVTESVSGVNAGSSGSVGIGAGSRSHIQDVFSYMNRSGIVVNAHSTVKSTYSFGNTDVGFHFVNDNRIAGNFARSNTNNGFFASGMRNHVLDNDALLNGRGFYSGENRSNLFVRNAALLNTVVGNYLLLGGNSWGGITNNPRANFTTEEAWINFSISHTP